MGTLLYLTKHSRPDITNAGQKLSKCMDGAIKLQLRELKRVAKFALDTKDLGLCIVPSMSDGIWFLEALSDSDFANDKETRISIYGYIVFFCGVPIARKSKSMKSVILSTTEAEYIAVPEVVKEVKFLYQFLMSTEIKVLLSIRIKVDNVGEIWLANNSGVSDLTNHVNIRAPCVGLMDVVVTIDFVKSAENTSDIMTKNQQGVHFKSAHPKLVYTVNDMEKAEKKV